MEHETLFKKFQEWGETNAKEHTMNIGMFLAHMIMYSLFGVVLGAIGEITTRWLQGRVTSNKWKCAGFVAVQLSTVSVIIFCLIAFQRYFDDWMWSTYAGTFFSLMLFNTQQRLGDNLQCILV